MDTTADEKKTNAARARADAIANASLILPFELTYTPNDADYKLAASVWTLFLASTYRTCVERLSKVLSWHFDQGGAKGARSCSWPDGGLCALQFVTLFRCLEANALACLKCIVQIGGRKE